jgi:hypothetical protein
MIAESFMTIDDGMAEVPGKVKISLSQIECSEKIVAYHFFWGELESKKPI